MQDFLMLQNVNFIKLARDFLCFLEHLKIHVTIFSEDNGSFTGVVEELDLVENAESLEDCIMLLISAMKDYAGDFCSDFDQWAGASNRKSHVPYVLKIAMSSSKQLKESIVCRDGEN